MRTDEHGIVYVEGDGVDWPIEEFNKTFMYDLPFPGMEYGHILNSLQQVDNLYGIAMAAKAYCNAHKKTASKTQWGYALDRLEKRIKTLDAVRYMFTSEMRARPL